MERKEYYKHKLPHFQQPGQSYFVTWVLKEAVPPHALRTYSEKLALLKAQLDQDRRFPTAVINQQVTTGDSNVAENHVFQDRRIVSADLNVGKSTDTIRASQISREYNLLRKKYLKAYDNLLAAVHSPMVDLSKPPLLQIMKEAIYFWEGKRIETQAFCIMPNHVHWIFQIKEKDENGKPVYLQDIMHSIKRHTANQINKLTGRSGPLWNKESFDTTIRDIKHEYFAIRYTLNNPVAAGFVKDVREWPGNSSFENGGF